MRRVRVTLPIDPPLVDNSRTPKWKVITSGEDGTYFPGLIPHTIKVVSSNYDEIIFEGLADGPGAVEAPSDAIPGYVLYGVHRASNDDWYGTFFEPAPLRPPTRDWETSIRPTASYLVDLDQFHVLEIGYVTPNSYRGPNNPDWWRALLAQESIPAGNVFDPIIDPDVENHQSGGPGIPQPPVDPGVPEPPIG